MPQSILVKNIKTYEKDFDRELLQSATNRLWNKRFGIGHKVDYDKDRHILLYRSLFKTNSCDLIDYINKTIEGKEICEQKEVSEGLLPLMQNCTNCTPTEVISDACLWEEIEW